MTDETRMTAIESRLDSMGKDIEVLKTDVGVLKTDVGSLTGAVHKLHLEQGRLLLEIKEELKPLKELHDFVERVSNNHEARIGALEKHTGLS